MNYCSICFVRYHKLVDLLILSVMIYFSLTEAAIECQKVSKWNFQLILRNCEQCAEIISVVMGGFTTNSAHMVSLHMYINFLSITCTAGSDNSFWNILFTKSLLCVYYHVKEHNVSSVKCQPVCTVASNTDCQPPASCALHRSVIRRW